MRIIRFIWTNPDPPSNIAVSIQPARGLVDHGCEVSGIPRRAKSSTSHHAIPHLLELPGRGSSAMPLTDCTYRAPSEHGDPVGRERGARAPARHAPTSETPKKKFPREATAHARQKVRGPDLISNQQKLYAVNHKRRAPASPTSRGKARLRWALKTMHRPFSPLASTP